MNCLAVKVDIQAFDLDLVRNAQSDSPVNDFEDDEGGDAAIHERTNNIV